MDSLPRNGVMRVVLSGRAETILNMVAGGRRAHRIHEDTRRHKDLIPNGDDHRTTQLWVGGLEDLTNGSYIRQTDIEGNMFERNREGYFKADGLREEA